MHLSGQFIRRKDRLLSQAGESLDSVCTASADQLRNSPKVFGVFFFHVFLDSESYAPAAKHKTLLDLLGSFGCHADVTLHPANLCCR